MTDLDSREILIERLTSKDLSYTKEEVRLANYIKENYKKICFMKIEELINILNVSHHVINSYFRKIDFQNYEEFRQALRKIITLDLSTADRFQISKELHPKINNILNHVISKDIENLNNLLNHLDENIFAQIVEEILNAPEVIVVSTSASASIGIYTEQILNKIGKKTSKITSGAAESLTFMSTIDRNAIILCFGFVRYPKETVKILSFLKKRNFRIITITDDASSPMVPFSYLSLPIVCESVSFTDSFVTPIALVNTLAIAVSQLDEEKSLKYLNQYEEIGKEMGFYF